MAGEARILPGFWPRASGGSTENGTRVSSNDESFVQFGFTRGVAGSRSIWGHDMPDDVRLVPIYAKAWTGHWLRKENTGKRGDSWRRLEQYTPGVWHTRCCQDSSIVFSVFFWKGSYRQCKLHRSACETARR